MVSLGPSPRFGRCFGFFLPAFPTECAVGLVWSLMVLYDMCVLMSAVN